MENPTIIIIDNGILCYYFITYVQSQKYVESFHWNVDEKIQQLLLL